MPSLTRALPDTPPPPRPSSAAHLCDYGPRHPGRARVEAFIHGIFRDRFGAAVQAFAPTLVGLHAADGSLLAAAGYRSADPGPLFLERYLDRPIEQRLPLQGGARVPRARIVEVGHLAAARAGEGRRLIALLAPRLAREGHDWVVSTLTQELRLLFVRLGVAPLALGVADPARLGAQASDWGSYYDHHPLVQAGQLQLALQALQRRGAAA